MKIDHWLNRFRSPRRSSKLRQGRRPATRISTIGALEDRVLLATFTVLNTADSGDGSLRAAIEDANGTAGGDNVEFAIPGTGTHTIAVESPLPALTERVTLDGWSQSGHVAAPLIVLNGKLAGSGSGIEVRAADVTVRGFVIQDFDGDGINVSGVTNTIIQGNYIGTTVAGDAAAGNSGAGLRLLGGTRGVTLGNDGQVSTEIIAAQNVEAERERNIISGNQSGIVAEGQSTTGNNIQGNYIGTDVTGQIAIPNADFGIHFEDTAANFVGGTSVELRNVISGNGRDGIRIEAGSQQQEISGNYIGVAADGSTPLGNVNNGITIRGDFLRGENPTIVYTIDVSGSTSSSFGGTPVGDVNSDSRINSILDAELAGFIALTEELISLGSGDNTSVGIVVFASSAASLDMDPDLTGLQYSAKAAADEDGNGVSDVIDILRGIRVGHANVGSSTSFADGIDSSTTAFQNLSFQNSSANLIFVSDGFANGSQSLNFNGLNSLGVQRTAIGIGSGASLTQLQTIDSNAVRTTSTDEFTGRLLSVLGGGLGPSSATQIVVGGTGADSGNIIAYNGGSGVNVGTLNNRILGNSIHTNGGLGIDLVPNGVNLNDPGDQDAGANRRTNYPTVTNVRNSSSGFRVDGFLSAMPNSTYRIEVFGNELADSSGYGEGKHFLGTFDVSTDQNGQVTISEDMTESLSGLRFLSMTATDSSGNTSEFSLAYNLFAFNISIDDATGSEADGTMTFTVSANRPIDIPIEVDVLFVGNTAIGTIDFDAATKRVLIPANSTAGVMFTVPIVDDVTVETSETFTGSLRPVTNIGFRLVDFSDTATGTILDDDQPGFTIHQTDGSTIVNESGTTDTFSVVLNRQPTANVTINVTSNDIGEATPDVSVLQFTPSDWDLPQIVTMTGVDDPDFDGDQQISVRVGVRPSASDPLFARVPAQSVPVTVIDDDGPAIIVRQSNGSTVVSEPSTTDTFGVSLRTPPTDNVTVTVTSNRPDEAGTDVNSLTFTPSNWDVPQTVIVVPVDDFRIDGTQTVTLTLAVNDANSSQSYANAEDVAVTAAVHDNDAPGLSIIQTNGATVVIESGTTDTFDVLLLAQPASDVVVQLASQDTTQATLDITTLTFSPATWNVPQTVTATGVNNDIIDGTRVISVIVSVDNAASDPVFATLPDRNVNVTVIDDDGPGISVTESGGSTIVSESGTTDDLFIVLTQMPTTGVTLQVSTDIDDEISVDQSTLTFTSTDWNVPQTLIVTGLDDFAVDGDQSTQITIGVDAASSDAAFDSVSDELVTAVTTDDDAPTFTIVESDGATSVLESGTQDTFQVFLNAQPATDVVLDLSSTDTSEATVDITRLTFTPSSWRTPQTVTVIGLDDVVADGDEVAPIVVRVNAELSDNIFDAAPDQTVAATVIDDEVPGFTITETDDSTSVSETGGEDSFLVTLDAQPLTDVVLKVVSLASDQAQVDSNELTFTSNNWNVPQIVTATGIGNNIIDGQRTAPVTINVSASQSDAAFGNVFQQVVEVVVTDDDIAGFVIAETNSTTRVRESGATDTFSVVLTAQPFSEVTLKLLSENRNEVEIDRPTLSFTPQNWNVPRIVTAQGIDDSVVDGGTITPVNVSIDADATDTNFTQVADQAVHVTNVDDDVAGFVLLESDLVTVVDENGATDQVEVFLSARPTSDVILTVTSSDTTEATVNVSELVFTPAGWNIPQLIIVTGADDNQLDGNRSSIITVGVRDDGSDFRFQDLPNQTASSVTEDNDQAGFVLSKLTGVVNEFGTSDTFSVTLTASPIADVVLDIQSEDPGEVIVSPSQLIFDTDNWNVPQIVTATGFPDNIPDGNQTTNVRVSINVEATHTAFDGLEDQTVAINTVDGDNNDRPFILTPTGPIEEVRPTLIWSTVPDAVSYELTLEQVGNDSGPIVSTTVNGNSYILTQDLTVAQYRTHVRANFADGMQSEFDNKTFEVNATVTIHDLPFHGDTPRPQISWDAVPGAVGYQIQINNLTTGQREIVDEIVAGTSFTPSSDLTFGRHQIWIRPVGPAGYQSTWSSAQYYVGPQQLGPQGSITTAAPQFSWVAVPGAATYQIYIVGPGGLLIEQEGIEGTTFTASAPFENGDFRWWIRPSTADGDTGAWSPPAEFSTGNRTKVSYPRATIETATPDFTWPAVPNAETYEIYVTRVGVAGPLFRKAGLTSTSYPSPVLVDGDYKVWIRTKTAASSVWGRSINFTVATNAVARRTTPISPDTPGLSTRPLFSWRPTSEATSYEIYLHDGEVGMLETGITSITWTPITDLAEGEWTWSIRPQTPAGNGSWSVPLTFNTTGQSRITRPIGQTSDSQPLFRWQPVTGATRYMLQVDNLTTGTSRVIRENNLLDVNYRPAFSLPIGEYRVWIRAVNANDSGVWSRPADFRVVVAGLTAPNVEPESGVVGNTVEAQLALAAGRVSEVAQSLASTTEQRKVRAVEYSDETITVEAEDMQATDQLMAAIGSTVDWLSAVN